MSSGKLIGLWSGVTPSRNKFSWRKLSILIVLVSLAGCQTPYQQKGFTGGFSDRVIDKQTVHVEFSGNGLTSREKVERYFLYRCAEVTDQAGYRYFVVLPKIAMGSSQAVMAVRGNGFDHSMMLKMKGHSTTRIVAAAGPPVTHWKEDATIRMFNGDAVISNSIVGWDAREVLSILEPYVKSAGAIEGGMPKAWVFGAHMAKRPYAELFPTSRLPSVATAQLVTPPAERSQSDFNEDQRTTSGFDASETQDTRVGPAVQSPFTTTIAKNTPAAGQTELPTVRRDVSSEVETMIAAHADWDMQCKPAGAAPAVTVLDASRHGLLEVRVGQFVAQGVNLPSTCSGGVVYGTQIFYTPNAGFHGIDSLRYAVVTAKGRFTRVVEMKVE
ncbi:hypothetical protein ASG35_09970 [Burkholderia sp. Leaf177]|uniref:CC0125/CC1285 family lipoprotein n=1 Tax=Burkholderia sp. Leaf177 TaxID=1736287 RepID=UPI0006F96A5D|nr:hypothetical protein [Burkholderia sp. Leaf177]KQR78708.1 hypothetical protein ASG35_09970 [Burkholderia sp. Leaf177]